MDEHNSRFHALMERAFPENVKESIDDVAGSLSTEDMRQAVGTIYNFVMGVAFVALCMGFVFGMFFAWLVSRPIGG